MNDVALASVSWTVDDICKLCPAWSAERARDFLLRHEDMIRDAMLHAGISTIVNLMIAADDNIAPQ